MINQSVRRALAIAIPIAVLVFDCGYSLVTGWAWHAVITRFSVLALVLYAMWGITELTMVWWRSPLGERQRKSIICSWKRFWGGQTEVWGVSARNIVSIGLVFAAMVSAMIMAVLTRPHVHLGLPLWARWMIGVVAVVGLLVVALVAWFRRPGREARRQTVDSLTPSTAKTSPPAKSPGRGRQLWNTFLSTVEGVLWLGLAIGGIVWLVLEMGPHRLSPIPVALTFVALVGVTAIRMLIGPTQPMQASPVKNLFQVALFLGAMYLVGTFISHRFTLIAHP